MYIPVGAEWSKERVKNMLKTNDKAVIRGLVVLYGFQSKEEKEAYTSIHDNGLGFNSVDAEFLSRLAKAALQYGSLTKTQMQWARNGIMKYAGQLAMIANNK